MLDDIVAFLLFAFFTFIVIICIAGQEIRPSEGLYRPFGP